MLHAYQELRDEGLLELRRGRGAILTGSAAQDLTQLHQALSAAATEAKRRGLSLGTTVGPLKEVFR